MQPEAGENRSSSGGKEGLDDFVFLPPSSSVYLAAKRKRFGEQRAATVLLEGTNKSALIIDSISKQVIFSLLN